MRKAQKFGLNSVKWNAVYQAERRQLIVARRKEMRTAWKTTDFSQYSRLYLLREFQGWYSEEAINARIEKAKGEDFSFAEKQRSLSPSKSFGLGSLFG
jgi:hypothetical protein